METTLKHHTPIKAIVFDFDGTITEPGSLNFTKIREEVGCPEGVSILHYIETLDGQSAERAVEILESHENQAAAQARPAIGIDEVWRFLKEKDLKLGILTRNTTASVEISLRNIHGITLNDFDSIITRDDEIPVKPDPDGVLVTAARFGIDPSCLLVVGDFRYDIEAGQRAGSPTVYVDNNPTHSAPTPPSDFTITDLRELIPIVKSLLTPAS